MSTSTSASTSGRTPSAGGGAPTKPVSNPIGYLDDRLTTSGFLKRNMRKVFPDHWSFLLGEIAMFSFVLLLLSGVFLTLWFKPSMAEVVYNGSYTNLRGVSMSEAYKSTLDLSFDVRGGLLMRQIHHWAALIFVASMAVHAARILLTGAFRKPREINYIIGFTMLVLGVIEGFAGYSLPDDLLSGTGLRIANALILATPVVGTYLSFFLFGGEFPGTEIVPRLYSIHILLIPGLILGLMTAHLMILWYQKHTQYPGPGRTDKNVVGYPFFPVYTAKSGGFAFIVFGIIAAMGAFIQINPIWIWGPYNPSQVSAGSQPDWYMAFPDGMLRLMPNWETHLWGYTLSWNTLIPALVAPVVFLIVVASYPWVEAFVKHDKREHHVLQRPRNQPIRTSIVVAIATFYILCTIESGNDFVATIFHVSLNSITIALRVLIFVGPVLAFIVTKRICLALQRSDREKVLHGFESGVLMVSPEGEFTEVHQSIGKYEQYHLTAHETEAPLELGPDRDENGVPAPRRVLLKTRARLSDAYYADIVAKPTLEDLAAIERAHGNGHQELASAAGPTAIDGHTDDGPAGNGPAGNGHAANGHAGNGHAGNGHASDEHSPETAGADPSRPGAQEH